MAPPTVALSLRGRGPAGLLAYDRDELAFRSGVAAAPGTPLEGAFEAPGAGPLPLVVKVRRCRREPEGTFRIEGRLVSPTRALREALAAAVGAPDGAGATATGAAASEAAGGVTGTAASEVAGGAPGAAASEAGGGAPGKAAGGAPGEAAGERGER